MNNKKSSISTFIFTFASTLLLVFGLGTLAALYLPAIVAILQPIDFQPLLPIAPERAEAFIDINSVPPKQLYPQQAVAGIRNEAVEPETVGWIRIPSIDLNVPIAVSPSLEDDDVLDTLDLGTVLYPNGVTPGQLGNVFIAAHSTGEPWKGKYRFAFLKLNEVDSGHEIYLDYNNTRYTYKVTDTEIIVPTPDYRVISNRPIPTMTLMACWPLWSTDKRMLKHAELTNITKLTERPF